MASLAAILVMVAWKVSELEHFRSLLRAPRSDVLVLLTDQQGLYTSDPRRDATATLVIHGQRDYRLDVSEGFQLFTTLQMEGVPSKMLYFPDEGHWVLKPQNSQLWWKTVNDWVDQWTKTSSQ